MSGLAPFPDAHSGLGPPPLVGCAGWSLPAAARTAFPPQGSQLERYASVFPAVEINSAFYRPHRPETYARWSDSVPEDFRFSVKLPKTITHERRLRQVDALLEKFLAEAGRLGPKLGCLLVQLPPWLACHENDARRFFARLRSLMPVTLACEPRHPSWFAAPAAALLAEYGVIHVNADPPVAPLPAAAGSVRYFRLHGSPHMYHSGYSEDRLRRLTMEIEVEQRTGRQVWCVFDNTASGAAVPDALALLALLRTANADLVEGMATASERRR